MRNSSKNQPGVLPFRVSVWPPAAGAMPSKRFTVSLLSTILLSLGTAAHAMPSQDDGAKPVSTQTTKTSTGENTAAKNPSDRSKKKTGPRKAAKRPAQKMSQKAKREAAFQATLTAVETDRSPPVTAEQTAKPTNKGEGKRKTGGETAAAGSAVPSVNATVSAPPAAPVPGLLPPPAVVPAAVAPAVAAPAPHPAVVAAPVPHAAVAPGNVAVHAAHPVLASPDSNMAAGDPELPGRAPSSGPVRPLAGVVDLSGWVALRKLIEHPARVLGRDDADPFGVRQQFPAQEAAGNVAAVGPVAAAEGVNEGNQSDVQKTETSAEKIAANAGNAAQKAQGAIIVYTGLTPIQTLFLNAPQTRLDIAASPVADDAHVAVNQSLQSMDRDTSPISGGTADEGAQSDADVKEAPQARAGVAAPVQGSPFRAWRPGVVPSLTATQHHAPELSYVQAAAEAISNRSPGGGADAQAEAEAFIASHDSPPRQTRLVPQGSLSQAISANEADKSAAKKLEQASDEAARIAQEREWEREIEEWVRQNDGGVASRTPSDTGARTPVRARASSVNSSDADVGSDDERAISGPTSQYGDEARWNLATRSASYPNLEAQSGRLSRLKSHESLVERSSLTRDDATARLDYAQPPSYGSGNEGWSEQTESLPRSSRENSDDERPERKFSEDLRRTRGSSIPADKQLGSTPPLHSSLKEGSPESARIAAPVQRAALAGWRPGVVPRLIPPTQHASGLSYGQVAAEEIDNRSPWEETDAEAGWERQIDAEEEKTYRGVAVQTPSNRGARTSLRADASQENSGDEFVEREFGLDARNTSQPLRSASHMAARPESSGRQELAELELELNSPLNARSFVGASPLKASSGGPPDMGRIDRPHIPQGPAHVPDIPPGGPNLGAINPVVAGAGVGAGAIGNPLPIGDNDYYKKALAGATVLAGGYFLYYTFSDTAPVKSVVNTLSTGLKYASDSLWWGSTNAPLEVAQTAPSEPIERPKPLPVPSPVAQPDRQPVAPSEAQPEAQQAVPTPPANPNTWHVAYFMGRTDEICAGSAPSCPGEDDPAAGPIPPASPPPEPPTPPVEPQAQPVLSNEPEPGGEAHENTPPESDPEPESPNASGQEDGEGAPEPVAAYVEESEAPASETTQPAASETPAPEDAVSAAVTAPDEPQAVVERVAHPLAGSYNSNAWAANTMFQLNLNDRLASYLPDGAESGQKHAWIRYSGSRVHLHEGRSEWRTRGDKSTVSMGVDLLALPSGAQGQFTAGVMGGYGHFNGDTRLAKFNYSSSGKLDGYSVGLYGTYQRDVIAQEGFYADSWMLWNRFKNRARAVGLPAESYTSKGVTASVEVGYRIKLAERDHVKYVLQPHVQSIYQHVKADDFNQSDGARVQFKNGARVQTVMGLRAAAHIPTGSTAIITPYVGASWLHATKGYGVRVDGAAARMDSGRNVAQLKLGIQGALSNRLTLNADLFHNMGNQGLRQTGGNLMMNYRY